MAGDNLFIGINQFRKFLAEDILTGLRLNA